MFNSSFFSERLATMLNMVLHNLVGQDSVVMQVRNPQKYYLDPDKTLKDIINIYTNLSELEVFTLAIKKDGRYFNIENFKAAAKKLRLNAHGVDLR